MTVAKNPLREDGYIPSKISGVSPVPSVRTVTSGSSTTDWLNVVLSRILNRASGAEARQLAIAGDRSVIPLVYGEDRVGGLIANIVPSGANVLVQVVWALAGDSVNDIKYNDLALPSGASATSYDGSQVSVDATIAAAFTAQSITYAEALTGYMYSVITMPQSAFSGSLQFSAKIKGRKCYDPRTTTTVWTDNPSLHLLDFLESTSYGCGKTVERSTVTAVANANDALVGGSEKRRLSGLAFVDTMSVYDIAEILRAHAGTFLVPGSAGIKFVADAARTTDTTYSHASGEIAAIGRVTKKDVGNVPTVVEVIYTDTSVFPWKDGSAVVEAAGVDSTVPRRTSQVRMPGVQRYSQAKREATERLNKLRTADLEVVLDVFDKGIAHEVGDVIEVTHPVGLSSKKLRIADPELIGANLWRLTCTEYDPAAYSDDVTAAPTYADTNLINPTTVPPNLSAFSVTVLADGTRRFSITAASGAPAGSRIIVRYVSGSSSTWSAMSQFFTLAYDPNVTAYTHETSLPIEGTWSFGAKLVNPFGTECATAQFITAQGLGTQPKRYDATFNVVRNSDFTHSLGTAYDFPNSRADAAALPHWTLGAGGGVSSTAVNIFRNYNYGHSLNVGLGGAVLSTYARGTGTATSGYWYLASEHFPVSSGQTFEATMYVNPYNCVVQLVLDFHSTATTWLNTGTQGQYTSTGGTAYTGDTRDPMTWPRLFVYGTASANGFATVALIKYVTLSTGTADSSAVLMHKSQLSRWGGGTSSAEALPWVPSNAVETGQVATVGLASNAATEVYTAASSGTGHARWDVLTPSGSWGFEQLCSVAVPIEAGDKLGIYVALVGDAGNVPAIYDYARVAYDVELSYGTGTAFKGSSPYNTGNRRAVDAGATNNATVREVAFTESFSITTSGTATVHGGAGVCTWGAGTGYTEAGQVLLRVERIKR